MARTPIAVVPKTISTTTLTDLEYEVPANTVSTPFLDLTNNSSSILDINIFISDGTTDFIFCNVKIPAGIGKKKRVVALSDQKLGTGFSIKVQATTTDAFNAFLSVSEVVDDALVQ